MKNKEVQESLRLVCEKLEWLRENTKLPAYKEQELALAQAEVRKVWIECGRKCQFETGNGEFIIK